MRISQRIHKFLYIIIGSFIFFYIYNFNIIEEIFYLQASLSYSCLREGIPSGLLRTPLPEDFICDDGPGYSCIQR